MRDLLPFVQFKKREKQSWSVIFSKVAGKVKVVLLHGCFLRFLNCTNGAKSCNASQTCFTNKLLRSAESLYYVTILENVYY